MSFCFGININLLIYIHRFYTLLLLTQTIVVDLLNKAIKYLELINVINYKVIIINIRER